MCARPFVTSFMEDDHQTQEDGTSDTSEQQVTERNAMTTTQATTTKTTPTLVRNTRKRKLLHPLHPKIKTDINSNNSATNGTTQSNKTNNISTDSNNNDNVHNTASTIHNKSNNNYNNSSDTEKNKMPSSSNSNNNNDIEIFSEVHNEEDVEKLQAEVLELRKILQDLQQKKKEAEVTRQEHLDKLHTYNDVKDLGQALLGQLAILEGVTTKEMYPRFGLELDD